MDLKKDIMVKVESPVDTIALDVGVKTTLWGLKLIITRQIPIDAENFRLIYRGKVYNDKTKVVELPGFNEGETVRMEFNRTEMAREQTYRYVRKLGMMTEEKFKSLEKKLYEQEAEWEGLEGRDLPPVEHKEPKEKFSRLETLKHKISPPLTPEEKALKQRVKKRAKEIETRLEKSYRFNTVFYHESPLPLINISINDVTITACVSTGTSVSVMLPSCAVKCDLMSLIDPRFPESGSGPIQKPANMGRINHTRFSMGTWTGNFHISIAEEGNMECLLGLDFLKHFKMNVNIADNCLDLPNGEKQLFVGFDEAVDPPEGPHHYMDDDEGPAIHKWEL